MRLKLLIPNVFDVPFDLIVTAGYLLVTFGYLIANCGYFWLLLVTSGSSF